MKPEIYGDREKKFVLYVRKHNRETLYNTYTSIEL